MFTKKVIYLLGILMLFACTKEEDKYAVVSLNIEDEPFIIVRHGLDDIYIWDMKNDTIYPNDEQAFVFQKKIQQPEHITILTQEEFLEAILLPNHTINISYTDSALVFNGDNHAGMTLLNDFERSFFTPSESRKYNLDSTAYQVQQRIDTQKNKELEQLQLLIDNDEIEEELAEVLRAEIDYFYAQRTQQVILNKRKQKIPIDDELIALFDETIEKYPLEVDYKTSRWFTYVESNLFHRKMYEQMADGLLTKDSIASMYDNGDWITFQYKLISEYPNLEITEQALANFMITTLKQKNYELELTTAFEDFQKTYPNSIYTKYIAPEIEVVKEYNQKIAGPMPSNVEFIEGEEFATMDALINHLKGDKYYVDIWASWCTPCKREFQYNDQLETLLKSKNYKKLYISLDKEEYEEKWKQSIKYYDLSGLHMRASLDFFKNFEQTYSLNKSYVSIPQYLVIDESGNIVTNNAPRPSNLKALKEILTE